VKADITPERALAIVTARIRRPPQDALEAAVVLEAWSGIPADQSLPLAREVMAAAALEDGKHDASGTRPPHKAAGAQPDSGVIVESVSLMVSMIAVATWAAPLGVELGVPLIERALFVALPLTLCLQWALRSRYLANPSGIPRLRADGGRLAALVVVLLALPAAVFGLAGLVAALLVGAWVGGTVLVRRGWALLYVAIVIAAALAMASGRVSPVVVLAIASVITSGVVALAIGTDRRPPPTRQPPSWAGVGNAGLIGLALGVMLVGDPSAGWGVHGALPAIALLPAMVGSLWGGYYLWRFQELVAQAIEGVPVADANRVSVTGIALSVFGGAVLRLAAATTALSLLLLGLASATGTPVSSSSLLAAFGCIALVTLVASLIVSLGFAPFALLSVAAGVALELVIAPTQPPGIPGAGILLGSALTTLVALPPLLIVLMRPGRVLATALWIR
jgi:hypothetical protein